MLQSFDMQPSVGKQLAEKQTSTATVARHASAWELDSACREKPHKLNKTQAKTCRCERITTRSGPAHWPWEKSPSRQPAAGLRCPLAVGEKARRDDQPQQYYSISNAASAHCNFFKGPPTWTGARLTKVVDPVHGRSRTLCALSGLLQSSSTVNLLPLQSIPVVIRTSDNLSGCAGPLGTRQGVNIDRLGVTCTLTQLPPAPRVCHTSPPRLSV